MAYTLPGHRVIHMNAKALQMYGFKSVEEAQQRLGAALRKVYYPQTDTIKHLKKLRNEDDMVDYECVIGKGESNECHALAKTKVVVIPSGERAVITTFLDVSDMITLRKALKQAEELDVVLIPYELAKGMEETKQIIAGIRPGQSVGIFIGPEGGFEEEEVALAMKTGANPVTLGKRILRTETAGLTMLSVLMFHLEG